MTKTSLKTPLLILLLTCALFSCRAVEKQVIKAQAPDNLLVSGLSQPLNIHSVTPGLSWHANVTTQTHFQIQVASSEDALVKSVADLWNSGKTEGRRSVHIQPRVPKANSATVDFISPTTKVVP